MNQPMHWRGGSVLFCCLLYFFSFLQAQDSESIAVLDLEGRGISSFEAASLTDRLRSQLVRTGKVKVVERGQMNQILSEQDFQLAGCTSDECAVEIGQMLGVTSMVAGSIGKIGSTYTIDLRTIDVSSGEITSSIIKDFRGEIDGLIALMGSVAAELVAARGIKEETPLVAKSLITVGSQPPGAMILIDGLGVGNTPQSGLEIESNQPHTISLSLEGYQSVDTTLFAEAGAQYALEFPLKALRSWVTILSTPPGASISVDNLGVGTTPQSGLEVEPNQSHAISINLAGYQTLDTTLFTEAGQFYELNVPMVRFKTLLSVLSAPSGAIISLNGRRIGTTPLSRFEITPNQRHRLLLKLNGYQPFDTTYVVQVGGHGRFTFRLRPVKRKLAAAAPPRQPRPTVAPGKEGGGLKWLVLAAAAGGGYYGYTAGWFGGDVIEPPEDGNGPLPIDWNPPSVPAP